MASADSLTGYNNLRSPAVVAANPNFVPARIVLQYPLFSPGSHAKNVACPIYFAICEKDTVCPPGPTKKYAKEAPKGRSKVYDMGHFDIYVGKDFEIAVADYIEFYKEVL